MYVGEIEAGYHKSLIDKKLITQSICARKDCPRARSVSRMMCMMHHLSMFTFDEQHTIYEY